MKNQKNTLLHQSASETRLRLEKRPLPSAVLLHKAVEVSFEFFPPTGDTASTSFKQAVAQLARLNPRFASVTYGAGGSTQNRSIEAIKCLMAESTGHGPLRAAGHLTCAGASKQQTNGVIDQYLQNGIHHIVALRGDAQDQTRVYHAHPQGYQNAADLVAGIRRRSEHIKDFEISVAAYPEVHPDSKDAKHDLDNLKRKIDAGANRAITQFFFDADTFLRFRDAAYTAGITAPIVPGILPVTNFSRVVDFSARCGTTIPDWMAELFHGLDDAPEIRQMVATTVTAELCTRLIDNGVNTFHFYTLNRPELTQAICHILGVRNFVNEKPVSQVVEV